MKRDPAKWFKELEKRLLKRLTRDEILDARNMIAQWLDETTRRMVCRPEFIIIIGHGECIIEVDGQKNVCTGKILATLIALCETTMIEIDGAVAQENTGTNVKQIVISPEWKELAEEVHAFTNQWWECKMLVICILDRHERRLWAPIPMSAR